MAKKKIHEFTNNASPNNADMFLFEDAATGEYYKITKSQLSSIISSGTPNEEIITSVDGSLPTILAHTPISGTLNIYMNGQRLTNTIDFDILADTITWKYTFESTTVVANYKY